MRNSEGCDIYIQPYAAQDRNAGYILVDLDSTNGIEVNGQHTRRAKLDTGDTITLGSTEIVFARELP